MQIWPSRAAARAAQADAQADSRVALAQTRYQVGRVDQAAVLAAAADRDQRHFSTHKFTERPSFPSLPGIPVPGTHFVRLLH